MLSVILLSYFSGERISLVYNKLTELLGANNIPFELIIVDDGSEDNSFRIALELEKGNTNVRAFQLSRNYTSHYAVFAGLSVCKGDCAMPIPDDEQQPYETIVEMYRLWEKGQKVIIPNRISRDDGFFRAVATNFFYKILSWLSDIKYPYGGADSFLIDRELIDILDKINPTNISIVSELLNLGYNPYFFPYARVKSNIKKSRWTSKKKRKLLNDMIYPTSLFPIKVIKYIGLSLIIISLLSVFSFSINVIDKLEVFYSIKSSFWSPFTSFFAFFSGLILFALGVIGEYIWRILCEVKNRPGYIIKKKENEN
ncbi:MAG TPA: glycosyltransferase [Bacteroidales bacterium]|nr:glycosyltransferase [Bacteroidales bacterium]